MRIHPLISEPVRPDPLENVSTFSLRQHYLVQVPRVDPESSQPSAAQLPPFLRVITNIRFKPCGAG